MDCVQKCVRYLEVFVVQVFSKVQNLIDVQKSPEDFKRHGIFIHSQFSLKQKQMPELTLQETYY